MRRGFLYGGQEFLFRSLVLALQSKKNSASEASEAPDSRCRRARVDGVPPDIGCGQECRLDTMDGGRLVLWDTEDDVDESGIEEVRSDRGVRFRMFIFRLLIQMPSLRYSTRCGSEFRYPKFKIQLVAAAGGCHAPLACLLLKNPMSETKKPERPIWPTYSWRAKNTNAQLFYVTDHRQVDLALVKLPTGPLGFDLEWRPNFIKGQLENPVALVQLSNEDTILLIQISAMQGTLRNFAQHFCLNAIPEFPSKLRDLLENPAIVKAGVGIQRQSTHYFLLCCGNLISRQMTARNSMLIGTFQSAIVLTCRFLRGALIMHAGRDDTSNPLDSAD